MTAQIDNSFLLPPVIYGERVRIKRKKCVDRTTLLMSIAVVTAVFTGNIVLAEVDPDYDPPLSPLSIVPVPPDNPIILNKVELGKMLFFDPKLTGDGSISCSSCHDQKKGWASDTPMSRGYPGTTHWRNAQTVVNSGYLGKLFWQGSALSLEEQAPFANMGAVGGNGKQDVMESR